MRNQEIDMKALFRKLCLTQIYLKMLNFSIGIYTRFN